MLDGLKLLRSIAANPAAFPAVIADAEKVARSLVVGQLKAKTSGLASLRVVHRVLGDEFILVVEGMSDAEVKSLLSKVDKYYPELQTAAADQLRNQLNALAKGLVEPNVKPKTPGKSSKPETPGKKVPAKSDRLASTAMAAVRKRRRS